MRRTVTYIVVGLCTLSLAVAIGGWMLRRSAFDPSRAAAAAGDVLDDAAIVDSIANPVAKIASTKLPQDVGPLKAMVRLVAHHPDGHGFFEQIIHDADARLLHRRADTAYLTGTQLVPILRTEEAVNVPPVVIDVPRSRMLGMADTLLGWSLLVAVILFPLTLALLVFIRPDEGLLRHAAIGLAATGVLVVVIAYVVPRFVFPALGPSPWLHVPGIVASNDLWLTVLVAVACCALAFTCFARSVNNDRRRPRSSMNYYRYSEDRRWS